LGQALALVVTPVHPRACGERFVILCKNTAAPGSSPRLRGTRFGSDDGGGVGRFIPAPAGNAWRLWFPRSSPTVHPRACGERDYLGAHVCGPPGSSPRLRGTRNLRLGARVIVRFIPAPAGNATNPELTFWPLTVHPRACGERLGANASSSLAVGSSPRLRGTPPNCRPCAPVPRFIPAPAGNAACSHSACDSNSVHPRACGERRRSDHRH